MCNIEVVFVTPDVQQAIARSNADLRRPEAYQEIRKYVGLRDLAFSACIDGVVRDHVQFNGLQSMFSLLQLLQQTPEGAAEANAHIHPLLALPDFVKEVREYLQESNFANMMGEQPYYHLSVSHGVLVVGVEPEFFWVANDKEALTDFYRNALELCYTTVTNPDLPGTSLFSKFVKLSSSF